MDIFSIAGIAITAAAIAVLLRRYHSEYSLLIGLVAGLLIFFMVITKIQPAFDEINRLMNGTKVDTKYVMILFKCLGVCFVAQIASDACRDAGESAIASKVELAGKFTVLLIALPLFGQIADLALKLMSD
ncbi:MAG TPA: SpoIIIAC/SpoIIIAD family protein [Ruminiclostridium sp.]|jgi:stage III sporulation protein AD|nr:SpoIIIAC/SpoIIIAD family protein [Ruminiclostridium sp.]